ncbi:hypothetical protein QV08_00790 [Gallibacterium salpingitidis]|uniref:class I SAM-dependent methyltransferase n=1 Tax=Gallibacterium salpingitidis TaxID=505341 RepID=UPI0008059A01|nr:class I SAM-dependent methyltransferase [Gallibacterium salpingitidis]OBX09814.1 hypothetical protein QV08_00790 [Gallibacterium salpingitidis]
MKTIFDIDFSSLYYQHLTSCNHHHIPAEKWDAKAEKMAKHLVEKTSHYTETLLQAINIQADETVLDIGCGPGTLALPLAKQCQYVYALDYSQGMLSVLAQYQQRWHLSNISTIHTSWEENWDNVPQVDVIVASRSTLVSDLDQAIDKIISKAKKRVYLTATTQAHFLDPAILRAIGREDDTGFPSYIYLLNRLYQRGIQAELTFIPSDVATYQGENFSDLLKSVEFTLSNLTNSEKLALENFHNERINSNTPIKHGQAKWALIYWCIS